MIQSMKLIQSVMICFMVVPICLNPLNIYIAPARPGGGGGGIQRGLFNFSYFYIYIYIYIYIKSLPY